MSGEGPDVGPGTANLARRLPVGKGSAGDWAAALGRARARNPRAERRRRRRSAHASRPASGPGRCRSPDTRHLLSTYGARGRGGAQAGSVPPPPGGTLLPGPPRRGCQVSEGLRRPASSPLESPRNDVATRQLKKEFNYRDRLWELEQTRSVGGAGKQLRSERAGLDAARGARAPGSGEGSALQELGTEGNSRNRPSFGRVGGAQWKTF